jgi:siderophore synthetase component
MTAQSMTAQALTVQALLNCLVREVSGPERQVSHEAGWLVIRLSRAGSLLRARLLRPSAGLGPRLTGEAEERCGGRWRPVGWRRLTRLVAVELTLATGVRNDEFAAEVRDSHAALTAIGRARGAAGPRAVGQQAAGQRAVDPRIARYLASEQSLLAGHRFHPAPKARPRSPGDWLRFAPEASGCFPLRFLGVRAELLAEAGDTRALDRLCPPAPPAGYRVLPVHPWQLELLAGSPWPRRALREGLLTDLGEGTRPVVPTSSVRTVYDPVADVFCKFSLGVRITNCVRTSTWYELAGSVEMTRLLTPVFATLGPGAALLAEPGYRTVAAASRPAFEGFSVIVREGFGTRLPPGATPLLAASLTEPPPSPPSPPSSSSPPSPPPPAVGISEMSGFDRIQMLAGGDGVHVLQDWWEAYLRLLVPPVLGLLVRHGVAVEPHLQNVLVCVDAAGMPVRVIFRDLEGTKLVAGEHAALLAALPTDVARGLGYDADRAWDRVLYCLIVNHLAEIATSIADRSPERPERLEAELWAVLREVLAKCSADLGGPPRLRAVLAGAPLPGKANLLLRWARAADLLAGYVAVPSPWTPR